jgi:hypothetical protein
VLFEKKFVDRNAGERDFKFESDMPKYDDKRNIVNKYEELRN